MTKRCHLAIALCILGLGISGAVVNAAELLGVGNFHGDQVSAKNGEVWYRLSRKQQGYELTASKIRVRTVKDEIVDTTTNTGKEVSVDGVDEALFLVRGVEGLKNGPVVTSFVGDPTKYLQPGQAIPLTVGKRRYTLSVSGKFYKGSSVESLAEYKLVLSDGVRSQVIAAAKDCNFVHPRLIWAGDLDGDGRLDLLVNASNHYNVSNRVLWVSRGISPAKIVRPVAKFWTSGC